jgi:hypothetical protein
MCRFEGLGNSITYNHLAGRRKYEHSTHTGLTPQLGHDLWRPLGLHKWTFEQVRVLS